jgi:tripartite-type tricarboxylate transporter receptor subunit TctC
VHVKSIGELAAWLADRRNGSGIGVPTQGSVPELIAQRIYAAHKAEPVLVPYKGSAPMLQDLLAGQIAAGVGSVTDFLPYFEGGRLRVLAATREHLQLPGVPSFSKAGIQGIDVPDFLGLYAPVGLPDAIAARYAAALAQVSAMPEVAERFRHYGFSLAAAGSSDHALRLARMTQALAALVQVAAR